METPSVATSWLRLSTVDDFVERPSPRPKRWSRHRQDKSQTTLQWQHSCRNFSRKFSSQNLRNSPGAHEPLHTEKEPDHADIEQDDNHVINNQSGHDSPQNQRIPPSISSVWLPFLVVLIPNLAFPGVLLALVYADKFRSESDLFTQDENPLRQYPGYILVKLSATRLAIITSCSATLAPFLTTSIMSLWKFRTLRNAQRGPESGEDDHVEIHRIPQVSLLISLLGGSFNGLVNYVRECCPGCLSRHTSVTPMTRPVHSTALILCCCTLLVISMWTADTVFHTLSETVSIPEFSVSTSMNLFGHRLTDSCQNFDRSEDYCLPCTWNLRGSRLEYWQRRNSIYELQTNISGVSQVQSINSNLSILLPNPNRVSNNTEYRANTIGVSTKCTPITDTCRPRNLDDASTRTVFNCSDEFGGVIGQPPVTPMNESFTILDPDTPPLIMKPSAYLQFGFYRDADLSVTYNPVNYNVSKEGWAILFGESSKTPCPADNALLSPAYMGVAGRFSVLYAKAGIDLTNDTGLFNRSTYIDFMFGCSLEAFEVEYVWARGEVRSHTLKATNGSVLNMYIGQLHYYGQAPSDEMVSDVNQMALQDNSTDMASTWARLFSTRVLSVIGGYTTASENMAEQTRKDTLVARVHIGSLVFVISCGAAYALLVSAVAISAFISVQQDPRIYEYAEELSFEKQLERKMEGNQDTSGAGSGENHTDQGQSETQRTEDSSRTIVAAPSGWI
jgi:hypothetical protein